jgi:predicted protein tyrosine phosphatase
MLHSFQQPFRRIGLRRSSRARGTINPAHDSNDDALVKRLLRHYPKAPMPKHFLFICSQNRLRSPTAEHVFSNRTDIEVSSAGTNNDAENPLTPELIEWADFIVVMERSHRNKVQKRFGREIKNKRLICLDIPDEYEFMDQDLVDMLQARMRRHLPMASLPIDD